MTDETPNVLLEREHSGFRVELRYLPLMDITGILVEAKDISRWASVEKEQALDAFRHPMSYLPEVAVEEFDLIFKGR